MKTSKRIELRARVEAIKPAILAIKGWKGKFLFKFPEYDNLEDLTLLASIMAGRSSDLLMTQHLEEFCNEYAYVTK